MGSKRITIKSFNGIGDLLFATPTFQVIKEFDPNIEIVVNTNYPGLLVENPHVDRVGRLNEGIFLGYPDPIHKKWPTQHHIQSDFDVIIQKTPFLDDILFPPPELKPQIYLDYSINPDLGIGVQVIHKGHWHAKKVWPKFDTLAGLPGFEPIPKCDNVVDLVNRLVRYKGIVCAEGGISHICQALDIPCVVIYDGFANPSWNGYVEQTNLVREKHCSYCYNPGPCLHPVEERMCMKEIMMGEVVRCVEAFGRIPELEQHNQMQYASTNARRWCIGKGIDVGAGGAGFTDARHVQDKKDENAYEILEPGGSLDYVFSSHMLEHLAYPWTAIQEFYRVLKPGGILYLYLPNTAYHRWRQENMPKWHKHNMSVSGVIGWMPKFEILEVVERDFFFGMTIVGRKIQP